MYTLYKNLITQWEQDIGTQYTFYTLTDSYWGLLPSITATGSEKWDAVMSSILPAGDANLDGKVNSADISIVEAHMGQTNAWWEKGDFNHDGVVNAQDLALAEANLPAIAAAATFVSHDTTTRGNWEGVYGSNGYNIIGNQSSYPVYAAVTTSNAATCVWNSSTTDVRALQEATPGTSSRIAACWYDPSGNFSINIDLPDGQTHVVSIYADDWDSQGQGERVDVIDPSTGAVLASRTLSSFAGGVFLSWQLTGNVQLRFTPLAGPNAVVSGLFFDSPPAAPSASFVKEDTATQGNWMGTYGSQGYDVIANAASLPSYATVTPAGQQQSTWAASTTDPSATPEYRRLGSHRRLLVLVLLFHCRCEPDRRQDARPGVVFPRLGQHRPSSRGADQQRRHGRGAGYRDGHVVPHGRLPPVGSQRERGYHVHQPGRGQCRPQRPLL